jgi:hypothetical protein
VDASWRGELCEHAIAQDVGFVSSKSEFHDLQGIVISSPLTILVAGSSELSKKFIGGFEMVLAGCLSREI